MHTFKCGDETPLERVLSVLAHLGGFDLRDLLPVDKSA